MTTKHIFLVEIGTEEFPSKILRDYGESFSRNIQNEFEKFHIIYEKIIWFASARRLAVKVINIVFNLKVTNDCNGKNVNFNSCSESALSFDKYSLNDANIIFLLSNMVGNALIKFPVSVVMRWNNKNIKFVRPVRSLTILLDDQVISSNFFGVNSNRIVMGHRFMGKKKIVIDHAKNYEKLLLKNGYVIVDYEWRKKVIRDGIENAAREIGGFVDYTDSLLEEITGLLEWPVVLFGSFKDEFLCLPDEILLHVMIVKKKCFPVYDINKKLLPYFIFVINILPNNPKKVILAYERVLYSYFFDAQYFLNYDKKYRLEDYLLKLQTVLFYKKLGNLYDKTLRMKILSSWIANKIGVDVYSVERAAILSKCDLLSRMVYEFPFSQGIMGMYYARRDGELEEVALAQKEQYQPRFFSDILPSTLVSCTISIVDKIDTISGMFLIGKYPKGRGDPIGLRRASISVLRIIIEKKLKINLWDLLEQSLKLYKNFSIEGYLEKIISFMYKRLYILYETKGYSMNIIQATLSDNLINLMNFDERIEAVNSFCTLKESQLLFSMYKRIFNILKNFPEVFRYELRDSFFIEKEEVVLAKNVMFLHERLTFMCCKMGYYYDSLVLLLTLCVPVESFFSNVFIMSDNKDIRLNRLVLLYKIWSLLLYIMDTPHHILNIQNACIKQKKRSIER